MKRPLLAVVGASFAAGVGAGHRRDAWPEDLARMLGWRLAVRADPGAGYINPGYRRWGPFAKLAAGLHLARIDPAVVLIQGGHDDIGRPLTLLRERVKSLVDTVVDEAPHARVGVVSVFVKGNQPPSAAALVTDRTIVAAARQADPSIMVFDPLTGHWSFPRARPGALHPSPAGHRLLARRIAAGLRLWAPLACPRVPSAGSPCRVDGSGDGTHAEIAGYVRIARQNSVNSHLSRT